MNADEIVREARGLYTDWTAYESVLHGGGRGAKSDDGEAKRKFMLWLVDDFPAICELIESLQAENRALNACKDKLVEQNKRVIRMLGASQHREKAAVEFIKYLDRNYSGYMAEDERFSKWRGPVNSEKGENNA